MCFGGSKSVAVVRHFQGVKLAIADADNRSLVCQSNRAGTVSGMSPRGRGWVVCSTTRTDSGSLLTNVSLVITLPDFARGIHMLALTRTQQTVIRSARATIRPTLFTLRGLRCMRFIFLWLILPNALVTALPAQRKCVQNGPLSTSGCGTVLPPSSPRLGD